MSSPGAEYFLIILCAVFFMFPPKTAILPRRVSEFRILERPKWVHLGSSNSQTAWKIVLYQVCRAKTNQRDSKSEFNYEPEGREFESPRARHFPPLSCRRFLAGSYSMGGRAASAPALLPQSPGRRTGQRRISCPSYISAFLAGTHISASNARKRSSSSHCCWALSLDLRKAAHAAVGFSAPGASCEHAGITRLKASGALHRLAPGRKLCSKLVRTMCLSSA